MKPAWHPISFSRLTLAVNRHGMEWWNDPRTRKPVLRSRAGVLYEFTRGTNSLLLREKPNHELFK